MLLLVSADLIKTSISKKKTEKYVLIVSIVLDVSFCRPEQDMIDRGGNRHHVRRLNHVTRELTGSVCVCVYVCGHVWLTFFFPQ